MNQSSALRKTEFIAFGSLDIITKVIKFECHCHVSFRDKGKTKVTKDIFFSRIPTGFELINGNT